LQALSGYAIGVVITFKPVISVPIQKSKNIIDNLDMFKFRTQCYKS